MSILRFVVSLMAILVGVGGLRYAVTSDRGFLSPAWLGYLVNWLPPTAILSLVLLISLALQLKLNGFVIFAMIGAIAWTQVIALWRDHNSIFALSVMPLTLVTLGVVLLATSFREAPERAMKRINRNGYWILIGVVLVVLCDLAMFAVRVERSIQRLDKSIAEEGRKNRELKGIDRAAWLIGLSLFPNPFSEEEFVRNQSCHLQYWGDFRWDNDQQRLIITQPVFDETTRQRLLAHTDDVLNHPLLKPGVRDDLQGGVLSCKANLDCRIEWIIDVEAFQLNDRSEPHELILRNTDFIRLKMLQEFAP
jgi:hypothetical protein